MGDFKQSIYRFRGADPHVFRQLRQEIPAAGRLPLSLNFRSQPAVLEFVNALFGEELGREYEPLRAVREQVGPVPAVEFLWAIAPEETEARRLGDGKRARRQAPRAGGRGSSRAIRRREAEWIARRLREMLDSGEKIVWEKRARKRPARAVRPGDVALLFRALTDVAYYEEALRRWGIDYYLVGGHAFYAQQEIFDVVNLLRALANPSDEVSLVGVLRSPLFALLDETLFWLAPASGRACRRGCSPSSLPRASWTTEQARSVRRAFAAADARRAARP